MTVLLKLIQVHIYSGQKKKVSGPGVANIFFPIIVRQFFLPKLYGAKKNFPLSTGKKYFAPSKPLTLFFGPLYVWVCVSDRMPLNYGPVTIPYRPGLKRLGGVTRKGP